MFRLAKSYRWVIVGRFQATDATEPEGPTVVLGFPSEKAAREWDGWPWFPDGLVFKIEDPATARVE